MLGLFVCLFLGGDMFTGALFVLYDSVFGVPVYIVHGAFVAGWCSG